MLLNTPSLISRIAKAAGPLAATVLAGTALAAPPALKPDVSEVLVTVDGAPLPVGSAVITHRDGSGLSLTVSSQQLTCKDYSGIGRELGDGERYFDVSFKPILQADGTVKWRTEDLQMDMQRPASDTDLSGLKLVDIAPGKAARFEFHLSTVLEATDFIKVRPEVKLDLQGSGVAHVCKLPALREVTSRPQNKLKFTVAGRQFPVLGATISPEGQVRLSTSAMSCGGSNGDDLYLEIETVAKDIAWDSNDLKYHAVHVRGDMMAMQYNLNVPTATSAPRTPGEEGYLTIAVSEGKATRKVKLKGEFAIDDLPATISGEVEAVVCEP